MKKTSTEEFVENFKHTYNYQVDKYPEDSARIIGEILDISKPTIGDMNEEQTFVFRKRNGLLDDGMHQSRAAIAKELNVSVERVRNAEAKGLHKLSYEFGKDERKKELEKWQADRESKEAARKAGINSDSPIEDVDLSIRASATLKRAGINTVSDLSSRTTDSLKTVKNLGDKAREETINRMHELGRFFADEEPKTAVNKEIKELKELKESLLMGDSNNNDISKEGNHSKR